MQNKLFYHTIIMAFALLVSFNILPLTVVAFLGVLVLILCIYYSSLPVVIASLVLFGLPFIGSLATVLRMKYTVVILALNILLLFYAVIYCNKVFSERYAKGFQVFLAWWGLFLLVYFINVFMGPQTEYSLFTIKYLFVYGNFFVLGAWIVISSKVSLSSTLLLGALWFSYQYPLLETSILNFGGVVDQMIGIRGKDGFNPIDSARLAGLLMLSSIFCYIFNYKKYKNLIVIGFSFVVAAPLVWFSYTRQVYVAVFFAVCLMLFAKLFLQNKSNENKTVIYASLILFIAMISKFIINFIASNSDSRIAEAGITINRFPLWEKSIELIMQNPVMGIGVGGFQETGIGLWPHNWFLEGWLELGILGFMLMLLAAFFIFKSLLNQENLTQNGWIYLGLYFLIVIQVSGDIARNSMIFLFLAIAFGLAMQSINNDRKS